MAWLNSVVITAGSISLGFVCPVGINAKAGSAGSSVESTGGSIGVALTFAILVISCLISSKVH